MILDVLSAIDTQPSRWVTVKQKCQHGTRFRSHIVGESKGILQDLAVHLVCILVVEWRQTSKLEREFYQQKVTLRAYKAWLTIS